jgi:hypothetical protein
MYRPVTAGFFVASIAIIAFFAAVVVTARAQDSNLSLQPGNSTQLDGQALLRAGKFNPA